MHFCGGTNHSTEKYFKMVRKDKGKSWAAGDLDRQKNGRTPCKCFRCVYLDCLIAKYTEPPNDNKKQQKTVRFNVRGNHATQK